MTSKSTAQARQWGAPGQGTPPHLRESRRLAAIMTAVFWGMSVVITQIREFVDFEPFDLRLTVLSMLIFVAVGSVFSTVNYLVIERVVRFRLPIVLLVVLGLSLVSGRYLFQVYAFFFRPFYDMPAPTGGIRIFALILWTHWFLAWGAICLAILYSVRARTEQRLRAHAETVTHRARMLALRYQLNPHFLFNTFNSVAALVLDGKNEAAERMVTRLSAFLRRGLGENPLEEITLKQEVEHQLDYLAIEAERFSDRLRVEIELPSDLEDALVPGFILQPLVENAIKHGVSPSRDPVMIKLKATEAKGQLSLCVSEDSQVQEQVDSSGHGVGLNNVRQRLAERYGDQAIFDAGRADGDGAFTTRIILPLNRAKSSLEKVTAA